MPRYIVADPAQGMGWSHIFSEKNDAGRDVERERMTRFVYDAELGSLIHLEIHQIGCMRDADAAETADVEDSLKNANSEALDDPAAWGLIVSDTLPDWCAKPVPAPSR